MKFTELKINHLLLRNIQKMKYDEMTKTQEKVIPEIMQGKDVLTKAQTGSGKTASYLIPIINNIIAKPRTRTIKAVILVPTRDLVNQVYDTFVNLSHGSKIRCCKVMGGVNKEQQIKALKENPDILICVTGRLKDLVKRDIVVFKDLQYFVLDEVDKMLDLGFRSDILHIYHEIGFVNKRIQTILLSATLPKDILELSKKFLKPNFIKIEQEEELVINDLIEIKFYVMHWTHMLNALLKMVQTNNVRTVIFAKTIQSCNQIESYLRLIGVDAASINGDRTQSYRNKVIQDFKDYRISVLVSTDLLSRGIDIKDLDLVINFGLPEKLETYMHRIGRVGRAKTMGKAYSIISLDEEEKMQHLIKAYDLKAKVISKDIWKTPSKKS